MKKNFLTRLLQASLMCCLAVLFTACDEVFGSEDNPIPAYLSMSKDPVTLKVGETYTRTAIAVSTAIVEYSSSDPTIATVDQQGTVTGVAAGTAIITATATGYSSASGKKMFNTESKSYTVTVGGGPAPAPALTMLQTPLTFEAAVDGAVVKFKANDNAVAKDIEYSLDGTTWTAENTGVSGVSIILVNAGDKVMFRGTNTAYGDYTYYNSITCDKDCYLYGNIMSLIKAEGFENVTTLTGSNNFKRLFDGNTHIKNHTDATKYLVLPATTLASSCYENMFKDCVGLTAAPALPAPTLAGQCYQMMFFGCSGLTTTPVLNVDCDGNGDCMAYMFESCSKLTAVADGSQISGLGASCCVSMFRFCVKLASVPSDLLPATTLAGNCYQNMFNGCEKLVKAPKLPAPTANLTTCCYDNMFSNCTILNEAWVKADYKNDAYQCDFMFNGCTTEGTLHTTNATSWSGKTGSLTATNTWTD